MGVAGNLDSEERLRETERLAALADLAIMDSPPEDEFDAICRIAAKTLGTPSAGVSIVAEDRQWFKARHNVSIVETPREVSFCQYAVRDRKPFIVPDAAEDDIFRQTPLVIGNPHIRFYAGAPILVGPGHCIGALCLFDSEPRPPLDQAEVAILEDLAALVSNLVETTRDRRRDRIAGKVIETTTDAVVAADRGGTIVFINSSAESLFGYTADEAIGRDVSLIIPPHFHEDHRKIYSEAARGNPEDVSSTSAELMARHRDGHEIPIELSLAPWGQGEAMGGFAAIIRDITDRRVLEEDRKRTRNFLDAIVNSLPAVIFVKDAETRRYEFINKIGEKVIGRNAEEMIGYSDSQLFPGVGEAFEARDRLATQSEKPFVYESKFQREDGEVVDIRTTRVMMDGPDRARQYILGIGEDMTSIRRTEEENYRLARYDSLTGLLNRARFGEVVKGLVDSRTPFALLSIDLDRFKAVNDQFGHSYGDDVLKEIAGRLAELVRSEDNLARVGGDEFFLIVTGVNLRELAATMAEDVISRIKRPLETERTTVHLGASIGISVYPEDATNAEKLRENADLALYRAKNKGRSTSCFFDPEMDAVVSERRKLENDLRVAIKNKDVDLAYQPVVATSDGSISSVEALARWTHSSHGIVRPEDFISLAEECGLINELSENLLMQACSDALELPEHIRMAVNLSPLQFASGSVVETVARALEDTGLAPDRLQLEVTERLVLQNVEETFAQLDALHELGIQLLIDDFGVGHSSLSYFQRFPFDKVKIDKSFVADIETSKAAKAIVEAVVGLSDKLSMGIVAEGVETIRQRDLLSDMGCTHLQGYLFSKPTDIATIKTMTGPSPRSFAMPLTRSA